VSTLNWDRLCVSVHHSPKWTLIIRVHFASMRADYIPVQTATGRTLTPFTASRFHMNPSGRAVDGLTSTAIAEVLNHVCDVVIWLMGLMSGSAIFQQLGCVQRLDDHLNKLRIGSLS
jgi:hypothetical protein